MTQTRTLTITVISPNQGYIEAIVGKVTNIFAGDPDSMIKISLTKAEET